MHTENKISEMRGALKEYEGQLQHLERLAAIGQQVAGITHLFKNLLVSIKGHAELLNGREDLPGSAKVNLEYIIECCQQASHLVDQILDFSCKSANNLRPLNLGSLLRENSELLQRIILEDVRLVLEMSPEEHLVYADPIQILGVVIELALNARDAMPKGGVLWLHLSHLTLKPNEEKPSPEMSPGEWVVLSISDTGVGIPSEILPRIFEPFFTTKEIDRGTGLGLLEVQSTVKRHGGYLDVKTEVGKGTTFIVYLPAMMEKEEVA